MNKISRAINDGVLGLCIGVICALILLVIVALIAYMLGYDPIVVGLGEDYASLLVILGGLIGAIWGALMGKGAGGA